MQEILPNLCEFHNDDTFRDDTKNVLFESILLSLHTLYPKLYANDFTSFQVPIHESWPKTMQKLRTITQMEIRRNSTGRNKVAQLSSDKFSHNFIKMTALIWYIVRSKYRIDRAAYVQLNLLFLAGVVAFGTAKIQLRGDTQQTCAGRQIGEDNRTHRKAGNKFQ